MELQRHLGRKLMIESNGTIEKMRKTALSRRQLASMAGAVVSAASLGAQQSSPGGRDMLKEQRDSNAEALAELQKVSLSPADEPIFRLVVR